MVHDGEEDEWMYDSVCEIQALSELVLWDGKKERRRGGTYTVVFEISLIYSTTTYDQHHSATVARKETLCNVPVLL
jgi:hypothetical protein